jgi:hypothetical protein
MPDDYSSGCMVPVGFRLAYMVGYTLLHDSLLRDLNMHVSRYAELESYYEAAIANILTVQNQSQKHPFQ